ncbi:MAG: hypothetical protein K2P69_00480 [Eubacterium sp.]|nr:hypothetical protein [Eubacterium sp.]
MKKYWKEILLCTIIILIMVPLGIAFMLRFKFILTDSSSGWIGFWGSYLGAIFGRLITLFVLFKTLKENHKSQKKEHKINFCNELCSLSGKICGAINLEQIYILKYVNEKSGASKDDVYNALLAKNKANELLQICTTQLIAKIHDTDYTGVKRLMDNMEQLMLAEHAVQITFHYTDAEKEQMEADCNKISAILGEMRDWVVEFVEDNCK